MFCIIEGFWPVVIYDLGRTKIFKPNYNKSLVNFVEEPFLNISNYNIITIMTEWDEFVHYDWKNIYKKMKKPAFIFDGRNILEIEKIKKIGFNYIGLGRK